MLPKSKFFQSRFSIVVAVVLIAGSFAMAMPYGFMNPVRGVLLDVFSPFQKVFFGVSSSMKGAWNFLGSIGDLKQENERLVGENQKLLVKTVQLRDMESENAFLRDQLQLLPREKFSLQAAFVSSIDPRDSGNWIEISKGTDFGITVGMPVIISNGIMVGKIGEVHANNAQVLLLSNAQTVVNAVDLETGAKGVVHGEFGLGIVMDMVLQSDALQIGDTVVTAGTTAGIPRGFLVGTIQEVRRSRDGLYQQAVLGSPVVFSKLPIVFVVTENRP